ncbi:hypothetical protein VTK56DRAFT_5816 [Thermocarpiscus australiensis]
MADRPSSGPEGQSAAATDEDDVDGTTSSDAQLTAREMAETAFLEIEGHFAESLARIHCDALRSMFIAAFQKGYEAGRVDEYTVSYATAYDEGYHEGIKKGYSLAHEELEMDNMVRSGATSSASSETTEAARLTPEASTQNSDEATHASSNLLDLERGEYVQPNAQPGPTATAPAQMAHPPSTQPDVSSSVAESSSNPDGGGHVDIWDLPLPPPADTSSNTSSPTNYADYVHQTLRRSPAQQPPLLPTTRGLEDCQRPVSYPGPPIPGILHNIPPASAVRPVTPDFTRPRPPPPPYPEPRDGSALGSRRRPAVEGGAYDPFSVLIGPISEAARREWAGDMGKRYFTEKMGGRGVELCMFVGDTRGLTYVHVLFSSTALAQRAVEMFQGYACGGSVMWAWYLQDCD